MVSEGRDSAVCSGILLACWLRSCGESLLAGLLLLKGPATHTPIKQQPGLHISQQTCCGMQTDNKAS